MQGLRDCQRQVDRWCRLADRLDGAAPRPDAPAGPLERALEPFMAALADDINVQGAIGQLSEAVGVHSGDPDLNADPRRELDALRRMDTVLGILDRNEVTGSEDDELATKVEALIAARIQARTDKDWAAADRIRDEIAELGVMIKDGAEGTTWSRIVE